MTEAADDAMVLQTEAGFAFDGLTPILYIYLSIYIYMYIYTLYINNNNPYTTPLSPEPMVASRKAIVFRFRVLGLKGLRALVFLGF